MKTGKLVEAEAITTSLELVEKSKSSSFEEYQRLFDTAINSKLSEDNPDAPVVPGIQFGQNDLMPQPYAHQYVQNLDYANSIPYQYQTIMA